VSMRSWFAVQLGIKTSAAPQIILGLLHKANFTRRFALPELRFSHEGRMQCLNGA